MMRPHAAAGQATWVQQHQQQPQQHRQQHQHPQTLPKIEIVEQTTSRGVRFRYKGEGRVASIHGANSTPRDQTFPKIRIVGYKGPAIVLVSCVMKDAPHYPHPHELVDKEKIKKQDKFCKNGVYTAEVHSDDMTVTLDKVGLQCNRLKDIETALELREKIKVDPFRTGFGHKHIINRSDMFSMRLCFQAFIQAPNSRQFTIPLKPVVSNPVNASKMDLEICKLSHCSASVAGGTEIILLCKRIDKDDIEVRFFEFRHGQLYWEATGEFSSANVHEQVAISFRTPKYKTQEIDSPVRVFIQLRRPSDETLSEARPFQFIPMGSDDFEKRPSKRQRLNPKAHVLKSLQADAEKNPELKDQMALQQEFINFIRSEPSQKVPTSQVNLIRKKAAPPPISLIKNLSTVQANSAEIRPTNPQIRCTQPQPSRHIGLPVPRPLQPQQNLACQLQSINLPQPKQIPTNAFTLNNMMRNNLPTKPQTSTYNQFGIPNDSGIAMSANIISDLRRTATPNTNDFNLSQLDNYDFVDMNTSELEALSREMVTGSTKESNTPHNTNLFNELSYTNLQKNNLN